MDPAPGVPTLVLACAGAVAAGGSWIVVRARIGSVWTVLGTVFPILGVLSVATGRIEASAEIAVPVAVGAGVGAGLALYGSTVAFLSLVRSPIVSRQSEALYAAGKGMPLAAAVLLASFVIAPGEELFWRGLVQGAAGHYLGAAGGAAVALAGYAGANAVSRSLPVVLAALVGGAAWGGLAVWTDGVAASIACHAVWTSLMVARPPGGR